MEANEKMYNELSNEESAVVVGGGAATVNFDLNSYLFTLGAGAFFDGGLTTNVVNIAFGRGLFTQSS